MLNAVIKRINYLLRDLQVKISHKIEIEIAIFDLKSIHYFQAISSKNNG